MLILNHGLYGKFITTSYGDMSSLFSLKNIPPSVDAYARYLPLELTPFALLAVGIFMPKIWRQNQRILVIIAAWIVPFLIFYSCYQFTHETWWYMRFLLPIFPAIILAMILTVRNIHESLPKFRMMILMFFLTFSFCWQASVFARLPILTDGGLSYFKATNWANNNLPKNSIFITMQTSGALLHYTDFSIIRYESVDKKSLEEIEKIQRPIYAMLFPFELEDVLEARFPGKWVKVTEVNPITIWRLDNEK